MRSSNPSVGVKRECGGPVPDFSLPLANGSGQQTLQDCLFGKRGAVIVFWSAACAHCLRYDEYFNCFACIHPQIGFTAIASRYSETAEWIQSVIKQRNLRFPILLDSSGEVARRWHSQQTPRCYLITSDARLAYRGAVDNFKLPSNPEYIAYLEPAIRSHIAGEPIEKTETASFGCAIETVYYRLPRQL